MEDQILSHLGIKPRDMAPNVIVCGDPARATKISERLENPVLVAERREYRSYTGTYKGVRVSVVSHGIGAPGAAICFEEIAECWVRAGTLTGGKQGNIIRVGTCGGLQSYIDAGHIIVAQGAVDLTGYGREAFPPGIPSIGDIDLNLKLREVALASGVPKSNLSIGLVLTRDQFYPTVEFPGCPDYKVYSACGILAVEMEAAVLFKVGLMRHYRTSAIVVVDGNVLAAKESSSGHKPRQDVVLASTSHAIDIALEAIIKMA